MNFKWSRYSVAVAICPMSPEPWGRGWILVESTMLSGLGNRFNRVKKVMQSNFDFDAFGKLHNK